MSQKIFHVNSFFAQCKSYLDLYSMLERLSPLAWKLFHFSRWTWRHNNVNMYSYLEIFEGILELCLCWKLSFLVPINWIHACIQGERKYLKKKETLDTIDSASDRFIGWDYIHKQNKQVNLFLSVSQLTACEVGNLS